MLDPSCEDTLLVDWAQAGVVGIRFNLLGRDPGDFLDRNQLALARRVTEIGWQVEVQADGPDLPTVFDRLAPIGARLVIDHFGRPDPARGVGCDGFKALLGMAGEPLWVKLSAPYRCGGADVRAYSERLLEQLGPNQLVWGSDWPWTQHEKGRSYKDLQDLLVHLAGHESNVSAMNSASKQLFRFD